MVREGKLHAAAEVLESIPEQYREQFEADALDIDIRSRMALANGRIQEVQQHLKERRYEQARAALEKAESLWVDCPGLEEAKRAYQNSQQTDQMVGYELQTAKEQLAQGNFAGAREAMEFALTTMPDEPEVQRLLAEVNQREKKALLDQALARASEAAGQEQLGRAINSWREAVELLEEDDPLRVELVGRIEAARKEAVGGAIVALQPARVVRLRPAGLLVGGGLSKRTLIGLLGAVGVAIAVLGGLVAYLGMSQ